MEIDGRYENGIIVKNKILLWNKGERSVHPLTDDALTNVNIKLCENGALYIEAGGLIPAGLALSTDEFNPYVED